MNRQLHHLPQQLKPQHRAVRKLPMEEDGEMLPGGHRPQDPPDGIEGADAERWRALMAVVPSGLEQVLLAGVEAMARDPERTGRVIAAHRESVVQSLGRALGAAKGLEAAGAELVRSIVNLDPRLVMALARAASSRHTAGLGELSQSEVNEIMDMAAVSSVMEEPSDDTYVP